MKIPVKKLKTGFQLPVYGLGLWEMGGRLEADFSKDEKEIEAIRSALDFGVTHIDTAESYGAGHSEEILRQAIEDYNRDKLIISSKVSSKNQGYDGVLKAFYSSLERTGLDYLDLYLLHRFPDPGLSVGKTFKALDQLVEQGLIKNIGVSNMTPSRYKEAQRQTENKIVCNQVHYNLQHREIENKKVLECCRDNDVMLVAWRPLQKGILPESDLIDLFAEKYNKTPVQIAINWLITQNNVVTLAKTSNPDHLKENLGALDWSMDKNDIEIIREQYPNQKIVSDAVPLDYQADVEP